jgi:glutaredoxin
MLLKFVRWFLSRILLVADRLTAPKPLVREEAAQAAVDAETSLLALYQFEGCPFCIKVRRQIRRLGLKIELRDAQRDAGHRDALLKGGGELQVPCLKIDTPEGVRWMYESSEINAWLESRFGTRPA